MQRKNYKPNKLMATIIAEGLFSLNYLQSNMKSVTIHHVQEMENGKTVITIESNLDGKLHFFNMTIDMFADSK